MSVEIEKNLKLSVAPEMPAHLETSTLEGRNKILGLWFFLGAEVVMFACMFGVYLALRNSTAGGPTTQDLYEIPLVAIMTTILLVSSLTSVLGIHEMRKGNFRGVQLWFGVTVLLGAAF